MKYTKILKYAAAFILAVGFLAACNSSDNKESKPQAEQETNADTTHEHEASAELSLNNGAKWKVDSNTNKNVSALRNVTENAKSANLDDYHNTAKALQEDINKMISECKMKGPDHEALHHWLEPLMEMNKNMLGIASAAEGKQLFGMIQKQIEKYSVYFE